MEEVKTERREKPFGRRKTDLAQRDETLWKIMQGIVVAAILAAAGLTWQTREETKQMQVQLSGLCIALPDLKGRIDRLELDSQKSQLKDVTLEGRMTLAEKGIDILEKRIEAVAKSLGKSR